MAHAVDHDHVIETLVGFRVTNDRKKRRQSGAGRQQIQIASRMQVRNQQRTRGFGRDKYFVAGLQMLQTRGQRAVRHLDREEFKVLLIVGRYDAVGPQQRLAVVLGQADHHELPVLEAQRGIARGLERKQRFVPMGYLGHGFGVQGGHVLPCRSAILSLAGDKFIAVILATRADDSKC